MKNWVELGFALFNEQPGLTGLSSNFAHTISSSEVTSFDHAESNYHSSFPAIDPGETGRYDFC